MTGLNNIIFVISDSIGETGELAAKFLFDKFLVNVEFKVFPYIFEREQIDEILMEAKSEDGIIFYTLVTLETREYIKEKLDKLGIIAIDIMEPIIDILSEALGQKPKMEAGLNRQLDDDYFKRISALEFAMKYDNGIGKKGLQEADIVLIGISRTGKTPLSMYLATKDYKVANCPINLNLDLPKEIYEIDPRKIIGLTSTVEKMNDIRSERLNVLGLNGQADYNQDEKIQKEIDYAIELMEKLSSKIIDISDKAIEETATIIINHIERNKD